jgi:hypothetical protein
VHRQLYEAGKSQVCRMKELVQQEVDRIKRDMDRAKASTASNHIFNELVARKVVALFRLLGGPQSGALEAADPLAAGHSAEARKLFEPFAKLLNSQGQPVDIDTFEFLFKKFFRVAPRDQNLNVEERRVVLSLGDEKKKKPAAANANLTFKVASGDRARDNRADAPQEARPQPDEALLQQRSSLPLPRRRPRPRPSGGSRKCTSAPSSRPSTRTHTTAATTPRTAATTPTAARSRSAACSTTPRAPSPPRNQPSLASTSVTSVN